LGSHRLTGQPVTVEVLSRRVVSDPQSREQIIAEAQVLAKLHHPNLPVMYNFREESGRFFVVFERPEGITLADHLAENGPLTPDRAVKVFDQVLAGLHHAHLQGLFHSSLRPSLIHLDDELRVLISGFGFLKTVEDSDGQAPENKAVLATYLAPEQAMGQPADHRSDLYLTAVLFFEAVAGRPPFVGRSDYEVIRGHVENPPPDLRALCPSLSEDLADVIAKGLVKHPDGRFRTAEEFRLALAKAEPSTGQEQPRVEPEAPSQQANVFSTFKGIPNETAREPGPATPPAQRAPTPSPSFLGAPAAPTDGPGGKQSATGEISTPAEEQAGDGHESEPKRSPVRSAARETLRAPAPLPPRTPAGETTRTPRPETAAEVDKQPPAPPKPQPETAAEVDKQPPAPPRPQPENAAEVEQQSPAPPRPQPENAAEVEQQPPAPPMPQPEKAEQAEQTAHRKQREEEPPPQQEQTEQSEPEPAQAERDPSAISDLRHANEEEANFFAPVDEGPIADAEDDFSDLAAAYAHPHSKIGKWVTLGIVILAILGGGGYAVYHFMLDPYADVAKDEKLVRPASSGESEIARARRAEPPRSPATAEPRSEPEPRSAELSRDEGGPAKGDDLPPDEPPANTPSPEVEAKAQKGLSLWKKNRSRAVELLEDVLNEFPQHEKARHKLADYYESRAWSQLNNGAYDSARKMGRKAVQLNPKTRLAWFCLGFALKKEGKDSEAKKALQRYVELCQGAKCKMTSYAKRYLKSL
jgi:serine/threonine-protein kinase